MAGQRPTLLFVWEALAMKKMKKALAAAAGVFVGFLNGLFGSGGGMVAVPVLKALGVEDRKSHATSILVISVLSLFTIGMYLGNDSFHLTDALYYLPGGLAGAVVGALLLNKLPLRWLRLLFGGVVLYSAIRLFFR